VRELAERGVLRGEPGVYVSSAEAAEVNVPATLQATIAARIDRLDPKAKRTLSAAAVVGSRFGLDLLTTKKSKAPSDLPGLRGDLVQCGPGPRQFRPRAVGGEPAEHISECGAGGLSP
jgi:hypothetical protein